MSERVNGDAQRVIIVATPPGFPSDDLAFVLGMADYRIVNESSPGAAWKHLWTDQNVKRQRNTPRGTTKGAMIQ